MKPFIRLGTGSLTDFKLGMGLVIKAGNDLRHVMGLPQVAVHRNRHLLWFIMELWELLN